MTTKRVLLRGTVLLVIIFLSGFNLLAARDMRLRDKVLWLNNEHADSLFLCGQTGYFYNQNNPTQIDSIVRYSYDSINQQYIPNIRYIYQYDVTGEYIVKMETYITGLEIPKVIYLLEYDSQQRLTKVSHTSWDNDNENYFQYSRYHFKYNGEVLAAAYMANFDRWGYYYHYYKQTFNRDAQNRITACYESYSTDSLSWTQRYRYTYAFHAHDTSGSNSLIEYLQKDFMLDYYGSLYIFDKVGMIQESYFQNWEAGNWSDINKIEYAYDSHDRLIERTAWHLYYWTEWRPKIQYTYDYDSHGNLSDYYLLDWDNDEQDWEFPREHWIYTWEEIPDPVPTVLGLIMTAYPNPFNEVVNIKIESISKEPISMAVYNVKGQMVKSLVSSRNKLATWDGRDKNNKEISNGIYFIKAEQDGKSVTKKVIKIK